MYESYLMPYDMMCYIGFRMIWVISLCGGLSNRKKYFRKRGFPSRSENTAFSESNAF